MKSPLWIALALTAGLVIGAGGMLVYTTGAPTPARALSEHLPLSAPPATSTLQAGDTTVVSEVYDRVSPAVVNINFTAIARDSFGFPATQQGSGSGFVIDDQGHIATNYHVVGAATRLDVTLADGNSYTGEVVGTDQANDLAIIRVAAPQDVVQRLTVAPLGDSGQLRVGQTVIAIGNPFGLERSASLGIVSSLGRTRPGETERLISNMVQTDAAINPGNSGGPLLNLQGEVIGLNEQIESSVQGNVGIGFAVPINALKRYLPTLLAGREPQHAWLGVSGTRLTPSLAQQTGVSTQQGVLLVTVLAGAPAAQAGLRGGARNNLAGADIVTDLNGQPVRSAEDIASYIDGFEPGDHVTVGYVRAGQRRTVDVVLGVWQPTGTTAR